MADLIEIKRGESRFHTKIDWLDSWHSFSFGPHYDPANLGFGLLLVNNDDIIRAGSGFGTHAHSDMEIVTWVLDGELEHRDSLGTIGIIKPGDAQRMSAGTGVQHSEINPSSTTDLHLLQMWVLPDTKGIAPSYEQLSISESLVSNELIPVASGQGHLGAVAIHQREAVLWVSRLSAHGSVTVPSAPFTHVFVARGSVHLSSEDKKTEYVLAAGDAAQLTNSNTSRLTASAEGAEVLVWEMGIK